MGTMEGYLLGQALAPDYDTGPAWEARAMRERARKEAAEAQVQKLSTALEKEHKRFLIERRERKNYMRGWAVRGQVLMDNCGYSEERVDAEVAALDEVYDEELGEMAYEKDAAVNEEAGIPGRSCDMVKG